MLIQVVDTEKIPISFLDNILVKMGMVIKEMLFTRKLLAVYHIPAFSDFPSLLFMSDYPSPLPSIFYSCAFTFIANCIALYSMLSSSTL